MNVLQTEITIKSIWYYNTLSWLLPVSLWEKKTQAQLSKFSLSGHGIFAASYDMLLQPSCNTCSEINELIFTCMKNVWIWGYRFEVEWLLHTSRLVTVYVKEKGDNQTNCSINVAKSFSLTSAPLPLYYFFLMGGGQWWFSSFSKWHLNIQPSIETWANHWQKYEFKSKDTWYQLDLNSCK